MVGHIYGRVQLLAETHRPNMFINELQLYIEYLKHELQRKIDNFGAKESKYFSTFKENLLDGIEYYKSLIPKLVLETEQYKERMREDLQNLEEALRRVVIPELQPV
jgi:hypothetical protein